jgi:single-strand DNA-binding protein
MSAVNSFVITGRASKAVSAFQNQDGSRKMMLSVAVQQDYKGKDGKVGTDFINVEGYVPANKSDGVYACINKGDLISVTGRIASNNYTDKDGKAVYGQVLRIEKIALLESKAVTDARKARAEAGEDVTEEAQVAEMPDAE